MWGARVVETDVKLSVIRHELEEVACDATMTGLYEGYMEV